MRQVWDRNCHKWIVIQVTSAKLDSMDRKMLRELQANARLTNQELSEKVGLS
ncbi:AsnC family protein, partial [Mesorhizobium sp. M00.F.Ca.ET.038.03.1.1]